MTNIERFQHLQIELVRAGFETELHAAGNGNGAVISLSVELSKQSADDIAKLDALAGDHGFTYVVGDKSRAAISLANP